MLSKGFGSGGAPSFDSPMPRVLATVSASFEVVLTGLLVSELFAIGVVMALLGTLVVEVLDEVSIVIFCFEVLLLFKTNGMIVVIVNMQKRMNVAVMPL